MASTSSRVRVRVHCVLNRLLELLGTRELGADERRDEPARGDTGINASGAIGRMRAVMCPGFLLGLSSAYVPVVTTRLSVYRAAAGLRESGGRGVLCEFRVGV